MNYKKYVFLLLFIGLIPFPNCRPKYPYYTIRRMTLDLYKDVKLTNKVITTDGITNDSLFIKVNFLVKVTTQNLGFNFNNDLYATTKPSNGAFGMKDGVVAVNFTSDRM